MPKVLQVNISPGGVPKRAAVEGRLTPLGFEGDLHAHPEFHGGPNKALLLIASETIADLAAKGYPVYAGALGENLTTEGLAPAQLRSGDQFRIGSATIELTTVRIPCRTLDVYGPEIKQEIFDAAVKAGDTSSPRWARSGFYAKVIQTGIVRPNDIITLVATLA